MKHRFAFAGFRHSHIFDLLQGVRDCPTAEVVALCEENSTVREQLSAERELKFTHTSFDAMLGEISCDVVAIGDYYAKRGSLLIAALQAGKHVIGDKPLCTSLDEWDQIAQLAAKKNLQIGCQLDLRDSGAMLALRNVIATGTIGKIVTLFVSGQHPLLPTKRPAWYFEPGCHGGTINDIGIHAFDFIPWLTGFRVAQIVGARNWNAKASSSAFLDAAQIMGRLENGAGLLADFSYLAPDTRGYLEPTYWEIVCHGTRGSASTCLTADHVRVVTDTDDEPVLVPAQKSVRRGYLLDFLHCIEGHSEKASLTTAQVLAATREALEAQANAGN